MGESREAEIGARIEAIYRTESRRVFATLIRLLGDFDLAEEALHDAFASAVQQWPREGVPENPRAWLVSTGRFKGIDAIRRATRFDASLTELAPRGGQGSGGGSPADLGEDREGLEDDRLRLIFTCCHPALSAEAQVALTLREVCGLTTEEIARSFFAAPPTLAQRIVRAKAKIRRAGIPYQVPPRAELGDRLEVVLQVVYLVFNEGYAASSGESLTRPARGRCGNRNSPSFRGRRSRSRVHPRAEGARGAASHPDRVETISRARSTAPPKPTPRDATSPLIAIENHATSTLPIFRRSLRRSSRVLPHGTRCRSVDADRFKCRGNRKVIQHFGGGWTSSDAAGTHLLFASIWHGGRPVWRFVDGPGRPRVFTIIRSRAPMKYMLLIYSDELAWSESEREHCFEESTQLAQKLQADGQYLAAAPLQPVSMATSLRVREGKRMVSDGPFAETREQLGGYFLVEARDLDEAIRIAEKIPGARVGTVEIRPVLELAGLPKPEHADAG